ncbi:MAG: HupE/UreJ family protein [SAR324 cluster bacterium]|nr:HupE/UreJ family protein [SAR324 cluster bacterium]
MKLFNTLKMKTTTATIAFLTTAGIASAHTNVLEHGGLMEGVLHPFTGLDHLLAMLVLGIWAYQRGGRQIWSLPVVFLGGMTLGLVSGIQGGYLPLVETWVASSVFILGVLISARSQLPQWASYAMTGAFAFFHGHAHGSEIQPDTQLLFWSLGALISAAILHGIGIGSGHLFRNQQGQRITRVLAILAAVAGIALTASTIG